MEAPGPKRDNDGAASRYSAVLKREIIHLHSFVPPDYVFVPIKIIMNGFPTEDGNQNVLSI